MAIGYILQFSGGNLDLYDAVRKQLDWGAEKNKPEGLIGRPRAALELVRFGTGSANSGQLDFNY